MRYPRNKKQEALLLAAAIVTVISGVLEILEKICRWLL